MFSTEVYKSDFRPTLSSESVLSNLFNLNNNYSSDEAVNDTFGNETLSPGDKGLPHPQVLLPYPVLLGIAIYLTIVGILATFGNILFILTVIRWRYLRNNSHMLLLLNMAASDLGISIAGYPYTTVSSYVGEWIFGSVMCQLYGFLCFTFAQVNMNTLVAVSVFRYIAICRPHMKHFLTTRTSLYALGICWVHALFWTITPLVGWSSYTLEPTQISCSFNWNDRSFGGVTYVIGATVFCYVAHVSILIFCYKRIFQTVTHLQSKSRLKDIRFRRRHDRSATRESTLSRSNTENERMSELGGRKPASLDVTSGEIEDDPLDTTPATPPLPRCQSLIVFSFTTANLSAMELHVLGMNTAMVVAFITFWTPYAVIACISAFYDKLSPFWYIFPTIFAKTSCMINPILYGLTNSFLRKQFWLYLRGFLHLTTEIENFEVMRQKEQDGLYNKEGIFVGKKSGAMMHCACEGCVAARRQMRMLIDQQHSRTDDGVSPVPSAIESLTPRIDGRDKDRTISNGTGGPDNNKSSSFLDIPGTTNQGKGYNSDGDEPMEGNSKEKTNTFTRTRTLSLGSSGVNHLKPPGEDVEVTEAVELQEVEESRNKERATSHIPSDSIILNVNTLPSPEGHYPEEFGKE